MTIIIKQKTTNLYIKLGNHEMTANKSEAQVFKTTELYEMFGVQAINDCNEIELIPVNVDHTRKSHILK